MVGKKWLELNSNGNVLNSTGRKGVVKEMIETHLEDIPHLLRNFYYYTFRVPTSEQRSERKKNPYKKRSQFEKHQFFFFFL